MFDENGKAVYSPVNKKPEKVFCPYLIRVEIPDLNIRIVVQLSRQKFKLFIMN